MINKALFLRETVEYLNKHPKALYKAKMYIVNISMDHLRDNDHVFRAILYHGGKAIGEYTALQVVEALVGSLPKKLNFSEAQYEFMKIVGPIQNDEYNY